MDTEHNLNLSILEFYEDQQKNTGYIGERVIRKTLIEAKRLYKKDLISVQVWALIVIQGLHLIKPMLKNWTVSGMPGMPEIPGLEANFINKPSIRINKIDSVNEELLDKLNHAADADVLYDYVIDMHRYVKQLTYMTGVDFGSMMYTYGR